MRRVAIISDPHGDMVALSKVVTHLESGEPFDEIVVGGDLAQGGAQPSEVVDEIRARGWRAVRGNSEDLLVRVAGGASAAGLVRDAEATHGKLPASTAERAMWSVDRLGPERIAYLASLPLSIELGTSPFGRVVLVHATPWSTEDVVLPDASAEMADRMLSRSGAVVVLYGHIHTQYHRRLGNGAVASVGAINGSNDADPRPAYAVVSLGPTAITYEARRVDWPAAKRLAAYRAAGVERRFSRDAPGPLPVRATPGVIVSLWP